MSNISNTNQRKKFNIILNCLDINKLMLEWSRMVFWCSESGIRSLSEHSTAHTKITHGCTIPVPKIPLCPKNQEKIDEKKLKRVQRVIGGIIYYAHTVDIMVLPALGTIACEYSQATKSTEKKMSRLLDYLATKPSAKIRFYASGMVLNIHSDASYLSEPWARSRISGAFSLATNLWKDNPLYSMEQFMFFVEFLNSSWHQ